MRDEIPVWLAVPLIIVAWAAVVWVYRDGILTWLGLK